MTSARSNLVKTCALGGILVALAGCAMNPPQPALPALPSVAIAPPRPPVADGAIFQGSDSARPLFSDQRPRQPGDVITVVFDEQLSATKSINAASNRTSATSFTPGFGSPALNKLHFSTKDADTFSGGGTGNAANTFTGTLTAIVTRVLNNGDFIIEGQKRIAINRGTQYISVAGIVDPRDIGPNDSIASTEIADANIKYASTGQAAEAENAGWFHRIMRAILP